LIFNIGPLSFDSPDLAPLLVLCEFLDTSESLFWNLIRGQGLAYSANLSVIPENGNTILVKILFCKNI